MAPPRDPLIGRLIDGRYRLTRHIADGGMGRVYVAYDERLQRHVAVKLLHAHFAHDPLFVQRFEAEARAAARLSHPNVVSIHDQGSDLGLVYLAMELVDGATLRDRIQHGGTTLSEAFTMIDSTLAGLDAAHRGGIIHRDIKPENVLISREGAVKVADFGLARAMGKHGISAGSGVLFGTAPYVAPEQVVGCTVDVRSDLYSVGLVFFELMTGTRAFDGETPLQVAYAHVHHDIPQVSSVAPQFGDAFDSALAAFCAKSPQERPATAQQMREDLRTLRGQLDPEVLQLAAPAGVGAILTTRQELGSAAGFSQPPTCEPSTSEPESVLRTRGYTLPLERADSRKDEPVSTAALSSGATRAFSVDPSALAAQPNDEETPSSTRTEPAEPAPSKTRLRRLLAAAVVIGLLLAAGLWLFLAGPLRERAIPATAGTSQARATQLLHGSGFGVKVRRVLSETVPVGEVVASSPKSPGSARQGSDITLEVSKGPAAIRIPDLHAMSRADAEKRLRSIGLDVGTVETRDDILPTGQVTATSPEAGTTVANGTKVALTISHQKPVTVPDVAGEDENDAISDLQDAGLQVTVNAQDSDDVPENHAISTSPSAQSTVPRGSRVSLVISNGPPKVTVPDVTGESAGDAKRTLKKAGLKMDGDSWLSNLIDASVSSQDPAAGSQAPKGSTVHLSF